MKPKFFTCSHGLKDRWNDYGVFFSEKFCCFFSDKIEEIIKQETGITPSTKVSLSSFRQNNDLPMYEQGEISVIRTAISILPRFIDNINFCWKSKTGKTVLTTDENFDETDIECWIEGLKPALYWEQVSSNVKTYPFQVANLPYQLNVYGFGTHMALNIILSNEQMANAIIAQLDNVIQNHNVKSEAQNRKTGIVHNNIGYIEDKTILFRIDVGSAGVIFLKKILKELAKYPEVKEVSIDL